MKPKNQTMPTSHSEISIPEFKKLTNPKSKSKYGNNRPKVDGIRYDSEKEAQRHGVLKLLEKAGEIWDLKYHHVFELEVNRELICRYEADFSYHDKDHPFNFVVEDVKSEFTRKLPVYRLKKKLMKAIHGINIREV